MSIPFPLPFSTSADRTELEVTFLSLSPLQWIELQKIDWTDEDGKDRVWEMAARKTTSEGGIDAVAIAALLKHPNRPISIPM